MVNYTWMIRGIPLWLLREYLQELGGSAQSNGRLQGPGWTVGLEQAKDFSIGSLRVGQARLEVDADAEAFEKLRPALEKKIPARRWIGAADGRAD